MNVINKFYILIILILMNINIFSSDTFNYDISLGMGVEYGQDTINGRDFNWMPALGFKFYFLKSIEEMSVSNNEEEYDGEFSLKVKKRTIIKSSLFFDSFLKMRFSDSTTYGDFLKEDKSFFDIYLGLGYLKHIKKSYYMSFSGGGNIYFENNKRSFVSGNESPDIKMDYQSKEDSFTDYGIYTTFETVFLLPKENLNNLFSFAIAFTFNYKFVLREYNIFGLLSVGYKF